MRSLLIILLATVLCIVACLVLLRPRSAGAQTAITIRTLDDITGDGSAHQLALSGTGRWVQIIALSGNSAAVRIGDSNVSATRGAPVAAGGGLLLPPSENVNLWYSLSGIYYYAANGDQLAVIYGN